jgi:3-phosphoshikimate 1-carboxyvinyltransferase
MMLAIAATRADGQVIIHGAQSVAKSYPRFWEDYRRLGGQFREEIP